VEKGGIGDNMKVRLLKETNDIEDVPTYYVEEFSNECWHYMNGTLTKESPEKSLELAIAEYNRRIIETTKTTTILYETEISEV